MIKAKSTQNEQTFINTKLSKEFVPANDSNLIENAIINSWSKIAPFWPLKNLIAVNPMAGFEDLPFEEALKQANIYFQQKDLPKKMQEINRESIKWLQAFFDDGQATISMPLRSNGLYSAWIRLAIYDVKLHNNNKQKVELLKSLSKTAKQAITQGLLKLKIPKEEYEKFLMLMLTTLPGWASYIKYSTKWASTPSYPITQEDYLAIRLIITILLWPEAKTLLKWHKETKKSSEDKVNFLSTIEKSERNYRLDLLEKLAKQSIHKSYIPEAQLVFCIDVRSEPFRRAFESTGNYQTFGFAGFFGVPVRITNFITNESYASCPVLLSPKQEVIEFPNSSELERKKAHLGYERLKGLKKLYQSVKYTFITPFALAESLGFISGLWMGLRCFTPGFASNLKTVIMKFFCKSLDIKPSLENITFTDQYSYAENALKMIGITDNFAPLVVFCGHGSATQNNAYATALNCGACGGQHGASNARILAVILNSLKVRKYLAKKGINIPQTTNFVAAEHNTTTDEVTIFGDNSSIKIDKLKQDLEKARAINSSIRLKKMQNSFIKYKAKSRTWLHSQDWAQVQPEWGLARNAAFIIAPRDMTTLLDLDGRCFLHSYDHKDDPEGKILATILTAPMIVAQWINMQYFFSTLDNVAFGGGSKITKNITGKIGIMQGNASDLMTGLPLQSVYFSDNKPYHELQRLFTVVHTSRFMLDSIIKQHAILQKLFGNGWVQIACIEPNTKETYILNRKLKWQQIK